MNWLKKMMAGRYGTDQLNFFLLFLSVFLTLFLSFFRIRWLILLSYLPLLLCIYRMFSKNVQKRSMENYKFSIFISPVYKWVLKKLKHIRYRKDYKLFHCPGCKTLLKHPKGQGKITITCPKCGRQFAKKT